jgi:hypothetical protein
MRQVGERPAGSLGTDWIVILLSFWFLGGLYLDGWAHNNLASSLESFFTPWHAVFYTGFLAVAAYHGWLMWQNHRQGYAWRTSLPLGHELSLLGLIIFSVGGLGDMLWHEIFGIEAGVEALFSPTHLLLATGIALVVAGPMRSTSHRLRRETADWRSLFPLILSMTFLLSLFTFMAQFAYLLTNPWVITGRRPTGQRPNQFRLFAFLLPFILYTLYVISVEITADSWWTIHMLTGLPILAGTAGFLLSYLVLPPPGFSHP